MSRDAEQIPVALSLSADTLYYENPDMEASFELSRLDEIEYADELATGRDVTTITACCAFARTAPRSSSSSRSPMPRSGKPHFRRAPTAISPQPRRCKRASGTRNGVLRYPVHGGRVCRPLVGVWRSLVAHLLWEQGVGGSNPLAPTNFSASRGIRPRSSAGQSNSLLSCGSLVRAQPGTPTWGRYELPYRRNGAQYRGRTDGPPFRMRKSFASRNAVAGSSFLARPA